MQLCKLYHCTPSQLDKEDFSRVMLHLELNGALNKIEEYRNKDAKRKVPLGIHVDVVWEIMKLEGLAEDPE